MGRDRARCGNGRVAKRSEDQAYYDDDTSRAAPLLGCERLDRLNPSDESELWRITSHHPFPDQHQQLRDYTRVHGTLTHDAGEYLLHSYYRNCDPIRSRRLRAPKQLNDEAGESHHNHAFVFEFSAREYSAPATIFSSPWPASSSFRFHHSTFFPTLSSSSVGRSKYAASPVWLVGMHQAFSRLPAMAGRIKFRL
jgi:hypothetical protein